MYRVATREELSSVRRNAAGSAEAYVWSFLYREGAADAARLAAACGMSASELSPVLDALVASGRVTKQDTPDGPLYRSSELVLGLDDPAGWEASVLDHFTALVKTIVAKLGRDQKASLADEIGGSTYHFVLWRGHPLEDEMLGELRRFQERMSALRKRVDELAAGGQMAGKRLRVDAYHGQCVVEEDEGDDAEH